MGTKFQAAWRVGVTGDESLFEKQIELLTRYPGTLDEMALVISTPDSFPYMPLAWVVRMCEAFRVRRDRLKKLGLRVGINLWPSFGSVGHARGGAYRHSFRPMVGMDGAEEYGLICPADPDFLDYMRAKLAICAETNPDFIWVDDDMRFTHLAGTPDVGAKFPCFCDECVRAFEGGRFTSRESLVSALNDPANAKLRRAWCASNADKLAAYCAALREAVDAVDPNVDLPLMTVGESHSTYSGDYIEKSMRALRSRGARPGHGFFSDDSPRKIFHKTMDVSREIQRYPAAARDNVQFEEESFPGTRLGKAFYTRVIEVSLALAAGCTGVAFNHLPFDGDNDPYGQLNREMARLSAARSYFERLVSFGHELPPVGLKPADNVFLMAGMQGAWFNERGRDYDLQTPNEYLSYGVCLTADEGASFGTILHDGVARTYSDARIDEIFHKNVLMDGETLSYLAERGLTRLAGVAPGRKAPGGSETLLDSPLCGPFAGAARTGASGNECAVAPLIATELVPCAEGVFLLAETNCGRAGLKLKTVSLFTNEYGAKVCVMGYCPWTNCGTAGRMYLLRAILREMGAPVTIEPVEPFDISRVAPFARVGGGKALVLLVNAGLDPAEAFDVTLPFAPKKAVAIRPDAADEILAARDNRVRIPRMERWEVMGVLAE